MLASAPLSDSVVCGNVAHANMLTGHMVVIATMLAFNSKPRCTNTGQPHVQSDFNKRPSCQETSSPGSDFWIQTDTEYRPLLSVY